MHVCACVYLLVDPLSAVDALVGRHLFEECICGELAGKTRLHISCKVGALMCRLGVVGVLGQSVVCGAHACVDKAHPAHLNTPPRP